MLLFKLNSRSKVIDFDISNGQLLPFARALLALSLLLTLVFNDYEVLFPVEVLSKFQPSSFFDKINFYYNFRENRLFCYSFSIIVLLTVVLGFFPYLTGIIQWYLAFSFINISPVVDGGDQINSIICLLLLPINSLDFRLNQWKAHKTTSIYKKYIGYISYMLIKIQMAVIYFHAGVGKIYIPEWADGTAIYYWLQHDIYGYTHWKYIAFAFKNSFFTSIITWSSILLEILLFGAIFMEQKKKTYLFILGVFFHFLIFFFLGLFSFFLVMTAGLALYLLPTTLKIFKNEYIYRKSKI